MCLENKKNFQDEFFIFLERAFIEANKIIFFER